eukprot:RCo018765
MPLQPPFPSRCNCMRVQSLLHCTFQPSVPNCHPIPSSLPDSVVHRAAHFFGFLLKKQKSGKGSIPLHSRQPFSLSLSCFLRFCFVVSVFLVPIPCFCCLQRRNPPSPPPRSPFPATHSP